MIPSSAKTSWMPAAAAGLALIGLISASTQAGAEPTSKTYKIGIIGAGKVGGALGTLWAKAGDDVLFSSRHPEELKDLAAKAGPRAKVGTPEQAAAFGDVVFVAVPYKAFPDIAKAEGAAMKGKVVFDASNAIEARDGAIANKVHEAGIGAYSRMLLPGTHLVRGFNAINYKNMTGNSFRKGDPVGIPLASDDPEAIEVGSALVRQAGFEPIVVPLSRAGEFGPLRPLGTGVYSVAEWKKKLGLKP